MTSFKNLREAFVVFILLLAISILNAGQIVEEQRICMQYMNVRLTDMLELDEHQIEEIRGINLAYQSKLSNLEDADRLSAKMQIGLLYRERNRRIIQVLNERQRKVLHTGSVELISSW